MPQIIHITSSHALALSPVPQFKHTSPLPSNLGMLPCYILASPHVMLPHLNCSVVLFRMVLPSEAGAHFSPSSNDAFPPSSPRLTPSVNSGFTPVRTQDTQPPRLTRPTSGIQVISNTASPAGTHQTVLKTNHVKTIHNVQCVTSQDKKHVKVDYKSISLGQASPVQHQQPSTPPTTLQTYTLTNLSLPHGTQSSGSKCPTILVQAPVIPSSGGAVLTNFLALRPSTQHTNSSGQVQSTKGMPFQYLVPQFVSGNRMAILPGASYQMAVSCELMLHEIMSLLLQLGMLLLIWYDF